MGEGDKELPEAVNYSNPYKASDSANDKQKTNYRLYRDVTASCF